MHHIVAKRASNASYAKKILNAVGIRIDPPLNLVSLKTGLHRRVHTNMYYGWANSVVISAYHSANGNKKAQYLNVVGALSVIRTFLLAMNEVSPF
ncbi:MAG: AHH domain-containing protein [Oscillospiraceae bacterium]|nr:AHH domain-containing protein [Oscillospiraceae bacterium]